MAKDPICGMEVNEKKAKEKGLVVEKNGKKVYFCSAACKKKFEDGRTSHVHDKAKHILIQNSEHKPRNQQ
jgi:YHS domain-containing protein